MINSEGHSHQLFLTTGIGHPVLSNCGLSRIQERWKGPANFIALKTSHENLCAFLSVHLQKFIHFQNIHCKPSPVVTHFQRGICLIAPTRPRNLVCKHILHSIVEIHSHSEACHTENAEVLYCKKAKEHEILSFAEAKNCARQWEFKQLLVAVELF